MKTQSSSFLPILIGGSLILLIGFSIRASFGLFQIPIAEDLGWPRSTFSMAIAIQNLAWGIGQPVFGAIAEKWGDRLAIVLGIGLYAIGLALTSMASHFAIIQGLEVLIGFGIAGTGFGVILAIVGRAASDHNRSLALGIATAAGSAGQIFGPPLVAFLLLHMEWRGVFLALAALIMLALALIVLIPRQDKSKRAKKGELKSILNFAMRDINYHFIFIGFFSCGFQLGFITAHFPAMIAQFCGPIDPSSTLSALGITNAATLGGIAIALIGFMNIIGSIGAGWLGRDYSKKYLLSGIYLGRTILATWFILTAMTPTTVIIFSLGMGALWLATVPLTSGLIGYIYGMKFMGTLYGIVFLSHQIGSFLGVWIGGAMYDKFGNYEGVWWIGIGVGIVSMIIHLPIKEQKIYA